MIEMGGGSIVESVGMEGIAWSKAGNLSTTLMEVKRNEDKGHEQRLIESSKPWGRYKKQKSGSRLRTTRNYFQNASFGCSSFNRNERKGKTGENNGEVYPDISPKHRRGLSRKLKYIRAKEKRSY